MDFTYDRCADAVCVSFGVEAKGELSTEDGWPFNVDNSHGFIKTKSSQITLVRRKTKDLGAS